jgi:hypothetical protein
MRRRLSVSILGLYLAASAGCSGLTLNIQNDSFGTFQPFNNQYRTGTGVAHRSGFLIQVSDFVGAQHAYDWIKMYGTGDNLKGTIARGGAAWIDILCGQSSETITADQAALLRPDPNHPYRRLHQDLTMGKELIPITIWEADKGLRVDSTHFHALNSVGGDPREVHGHQRFVFASKERCEVRVWDDQQQLIKTYPLGDVRRIEVGEDDLPTQHGGVHSPPWNN